MAATVRPHLVRLLKAWDAGTLELREYAYAVAELTEECKRTNATPASLKQVVDSFLGTANGGEDEGTA